MKRLILISLYVCLSSLIFCQEDDGVQVKGFVDTYHAVRTASPHDFLASRSRLRGEMFKLQGNSYFFASVNAVYNSVLPELSKVQFREAYMEYTGETWGFKAGRQIIIWGKADGLKITDVISPMDLTEFLARDYDDIRMPVNGIVINKFSNNWDLDLICVPLFEGYILPGVDNPWGVNMSENGIILDEDLTPAFTLKNMEFGGKLSAYFSGIDIDFSVLRTWNKMPVYNYYFNDSTSEFHATPEYHRYGFAGLGISKSLNAFIVRGECAFNINKNFTPRSDLYTAGIQENNSLNYLVGIDWYPGNEWTVTGQFSDEKIFNYQKEILQSEHTLISTLGISKKLLRSTLALSCFGYFGLNEGDMFNRTSADYALSDNIHIMAGYDWLYGNSGTFGRYNNNTQVWVKAKFNF